jgi:membrane protein DedA with SNARE-associated domain
MGLASAARTCVNCATARPRVGRRPGGSCAITAFYEAAIVFIREQEAWAVPIVFLLAFSESLAFVSLLIPATAIMLGIGAMIGASGIEFWPIFAAAAAGAIVGDWLSYWIGLRYKHHLVELWPFTRHPELLRRGHAFFARWGTGGVFIGRFFGPLRAAVPLVAGICAMGQGRFQLANVGSALLWAGGMLAPGTFGVAWLTGGG